MILNNTPQNEAVLSNVGEIGEFRIRNSAKAFSILSSGLYANKIRAIIRELSCNAVDSHVAAGRADTPFEVHIPNQLEPWFSIRDYGTGLTHDQVTNIYTTYFESTKTDSNDFIGALGLGSKSPFSYTDNFTVTAIREGFRGIYTAFINEQGVPSIALMERAATDEANGVEVRFAVNDRWDFDKFRNEARVVYKYFKLRPQVRGCQNFEFIDPEYKDQDIIPGVHNTGSDRASVAVMGNIAYPIDVPQAETALGNLRHMLGCGLVMEFAIGELDFQASREGLSYIPSTVAAIKRKLEALNEQLLIHVSEEANKIDNIWERADYLVRRHGEALFKAAAIKYAEDTKFPLANLNNSNYNLLKSFSLRVDDLQKKYNISLRGFNKERGTDKCVSLKVSTDMDITTKQYVPAWSIHPAMTVHFVITDTKRGAVERAKYHWRCKKHMDSWTESVIVIEAADKKRTMNAQQFLQDIYSPPNVINASDLMEKDRSGGGGNWGRASLLKLETRERGRRNRTVVWANAGQASDLDSSKTYYYIEMNAWEAVGVPTSDMKYFYDILIASKIYSGDVYGVRKSDIELVRSQKNWVELNQHIRQRLQAVDTNNVMGLVKEAIDFNSVFRHTSTKLNTSGAYYQLYKEFKDVESTDSYQQRNLEALFKLYGIKTNNNVDPNALIAKYRAQIKEVLDRYPLLRSLSSYGANTDDVVDYINMVDQVKGN